MTAYQIAFHTPQLPPKLNLDFACLSGGGVAPSQFYGETQNGRDVYVRYRGGVLRVDMANSALDDVRDGSTILEARIGPAFDGAISLTQFCSHFGVTVDGKIPAETDPNAHRHTDFSGQTTYWQAFLPRMTRDTSRDILAACRDHFPNAMLVQPVRDQNSKLDRVVEVAPENIASYDAYLIGGASSIADIDVSAAEGILQKPGQLRITLGFQLWRWPKPYLSNMLLGRAIKDLQRTPIQAGIQGMPDGQGIAHATLTLRAAFPTDQSAKRAQFSGLGNVLKRFLPITRLERVDLKTGQTISELNQPLDPKLREWCRQGPDRWIAVLRDGRDGPWIGVRPVRD